MVSESTVDVAVKPLEAAAGLKFAYDQPASSAEVCTMTDELCTFAGVYIRVEGVTPHYVVDVQLLLVLTDSFLC